jgi:hypothetical protein
MLWLVTFLVMLLVVAGMAVGVMAGRKPIAGSCGGMGAAGIDGSCSLCGGNPDKCEESSPQADPNQAAEFYDASADK